MPPIRISQQDKSSLLHQQALDICSPLEAHDLLNHVLNILRAEEHPALMDISQKPVLIRLQEQRSSEGCESSCGRDASRGDGDAR